MKKVTMLAWIRTIRLLIKSQFNTRKALEQTDREYTETVSDFILNTGMIERKGKIR
jgi:hypothetical protein